MMTVKPFAILSVATAAALSLAGCGDRVEDHAERTGNAIAADVHAATSNVVDSVDALTGTVANQLDGAAARSLDRAADRLDRASDDLQRDIRGHVTSSLPSLPSASAPYFTELVAHSCSISASEERQLRSIRTSGPATTIPA